MYIHTIYSGRLQAMKKKCQENLFYSCTVVRAVCTDSRRKQTSLVASYVQLINYWKMSEKSYQRRFWNIFLGWRVILRCSLSHSAKTQSERINTQNRLIKTQLYKEIYLECEIYWLPLLYRIERSSLHFPLYPTNKNVETKNILVFNAVRAFRTILSK